MTTNDTRYSNPLSIDGPGLRRVIGMPAGGPQAELNKANAALATAMTTLRTRAAEIRQHVSLPSERARRLEDLRHPAIEANRAHAQALATHGARITKLSTSASHVKPTATQPGWVQVEDSALAARFAAMSASERMQVAARAMADPLDPMNLRWAECLLRVHPLLTGIDLAMHDQLRAAVLQAHDPQLVDAIQMEVDQLEQAQRTADLSQQVLAEELPGALAELRATPVPPEPVAPVYDVSSLPAHVLADLRSGGKLSMPAPIERAAQ